jgi:hypothetical protein
MSRILLPKNMTHSCPTLTHFLEDLGRVWHDYRRIVSTGKVVAAGGLLCCEMEGVYVSVARARVDLK